MVMLLMGLVSLVLVLLRLVLLFCDCSWVILGCVCFVCCKLM